ARLRRPGRPGPPPPPVAHRRARERRGLRLRTGAAAGPVAADGLASPEDPLRGRAGDAREAGHLGVVLGGARASGRPARRPLDRLTSGSPGWPRRLLWPARGGGAGGHHDGGLRGALLLLRSPARPHGAQPPLVAV